VGELGGGSEEVINGNGDISILVLQKWQKSGKK